MAAKWLIAIPAFASALLWNYCGLICTRSELGATSTWAQAAGVAAFFAVLLSGSVGVWIASQREPPWSITFAAAATTALLIGPALALSNAPADSVSFEHGVIEGAIVSMVGLSLMVRALLRASMTGAQVEASLNADGVGSEDRRDDGD